MSFPLISEYKDAILCAEDNFKELTNLRPVLDDNGEPVMSSGNFAVVFKMKDEMEERYYAVKCFLKDQSGRDESYRLISEELENVVSPYLVSVKYFERELFVDSASCSEEEFPVLLMDWVEGQTLDKYIKSIIDDENELSLLAYRFGQLAVWLIPQPFAHGDLKPDNILVRPDGSLVLVDYDGMFVPAMKGQKACEIGSPDFRHPLRSVDEFDEHIDDFSISSIALSLKSIACKPSLWNEFGAADRLLLSKDDYVNIGESECMKAICSIANDSDISALLGLFYIVCSRKSLNTDIARCFVLNHKTENKIDVDYIERLFEKKKDEGEIEEFISYCKVNIEKHKHEGVFYWGEYLALEYLAAHSVNHSYNEAAPLLEIASTFNVPIAKATYATYLAKGWLGFKQNTKRAFELFKECASIDNPDFICSLAICYSEGIGTERDLELALSLMKKSAEAGSANAQCRLGHWYYHGIFGEYGYIYDIGQKNIEKSLYQFSQAAEKNHHEACWWLSKIYCEKKYRNMLLAKYYSDKVREIQSSEHGVIRAILVNDEFDESPMRYVYRGVYYPFTDSENSLIENAFITRKNEQLYVRFNLIDKRNVDFCLDKCITDLKEGDRVKAFSVYVFLKGDATPKNNFKFSKIRCSKV